jgi:hypothetical protein
MTCWLLFIGHCACGALLVAGKCIRCEEEGKGG